jgi:peptidylprolyl isomerase
MIRILAVLAAILCAAPAYAQQKQAPQKPDPENTMVLETTKGNVVIRLRPDLAPKSAERLKTLTREGFYNNTPFHRVITGFMAQTGDGDKGNGTGRSKYPNIRAEFTQTPFRRGVVGMARAADPNSANSQFFIMYGDAPHLYNQYTVVGEVVSGMEVVDKLNRGEPVPNPDRIVKAAVQADAKR